MKLFSLLIVTFLFFSCKTALSSYILREKDSCKQIYTSDLELTTTNTFEEIKSNEMLMSWLETTKISEEDYEPFLNIDFDVYKLIVLQTKNIPNLKTNLNLLETKFTETKAILVFEDELIKENLSSTENLHKNYYFTIPNDREVVIEFAKKEIK